MTKDANGNHIAGTPTTDESAAPGPSPTPSSNDPAVQALQNLAIPGGPSNSGSDQYGLGAWGQEPVNTTGLFNLPPGTKADDVMKTFLQWSNDPSKVPIVAAIQHAMYLAGSYYSSNFTPVSGLVRPEDQAAFAKFITQNAQANTGITDPTQRQPLSAQLQDAAARGVASGTASVQPTVKQQKVYQAPSSIELNAAATAAAEKVLGRKANSTEQAAFAAYYKSVVTQYQQNMDGTTQQARQAAQVAKYGDPLGAPGNDVNASGVPLSAADQTQGQAAMDAGTLASERQLDAGNSQYQAPQPLMSPTDFLSHINDITNAANSSNAVAQSAADAQTGGPLQVTSPPGEADAAENFFRTHNAGEANQNDMQSAMGSFLRVIANGRMS